jgi:fibronectin-binding autotransporter adhesin
MLRSTLFANTFQSAINPKRALLAGLVACATASSAYAGNVSKANNTGALNVGTSWVGGVAPGASDVATWDATITDPNSATNDLGANATWGGIKILNPVGPVAITTNSAPATLTLGAAGIDMSSATVDLTMSNNLTLPDNTVQTWNVPSGRTLLLGGALTRSGGAVLNFNGGGTVNIPSGTPSSGLFYALVNGTDVGALDASGNLSTVASVFGYTPNPATGVPATQYMDMVNPIGATGDDWHTSGSTTYFPRTLRFNQPQGSRNFWQLFGQNLILLNGNSGANTILVTTNVGACDVILTGNGSAGAAIGMRQTSGGSEFIFDQENTLGSLYINEGFSVKTASLTGNMVTKRGAGRVVVNADLFYAGRTRILEGELQLNGGNRDNSVITVNPGATFSGNAVIWNGSLTNSGTLWPGIAGAGSMTVSNSLTLNAGSSLKFYNATVTPGARAPLNVAGNLIVGGPVNISILSGLPAVGQYPLIRWTNNLTSAFANFNLATLPVRTSGYLSNNITASTIDLVITNVGEPIAWATGSGTWDINGAVNWKDVSGTPTTYQELSGVGDQVVFEDTQSGVSPITVTLNTNVHPSSVAFNSSKSFTLTGNGGIAGDTGLTVSGSGTFTLNTTNTYSAPTVLNGATTVFSTLNNLGLGPITFGGGTLKYNGNTDDLSARTVTLASGQSTIDIGANTVIFANPIGNNGAGGFTKLGSGLLMLNGTNKYSGNTIVSQGTLDLNGATYISNSAAIMVDSGATLDAGSSGVGLTLAGGAGQILGGAGTITGTIISSNGIITPGTNAVVGTLTFANDLQLDGGTLNIDISATPGQSDLVIVGGALTLDGGTVQLNVSGTLPNGRYKVIQYGTLLSGVGSAGTMSITGFSQANKSAVLDDSTPGEIDLVIATTASDNLTWSGTGSTWDNDGTLDWLLGSNPYSFTNGDIVTFDDSGAANPTVNLQNAVAPGSVTVNNSTTTYTLADGTGTGGGKITGSTPIVKKGAGTLVIATANNNSGPTDLEAGTLQVGSGGTLGDLGTGNVTNNGALVFNQTDNHKVVGAISGSGSVTQQGGGVVTLTGNNTYAGPTTITTGTLQVGNGGANGSLGSGAITNDGTLIFNKSGTLTVGNIKAGPANGGALSFTGPATVTLNNGNTYINNTVVGNGVVKVAAADSIPSAATVPGSTGWLVLDGGASAAGTLDLNGFSININALAGLNNTVNSTILNSSATHTNALIINGAATSSFSGTIKNNGGSGGGVSVVVEGGANQTFDVESATGNTYSGGTIISNATVTLSAPSTIGTPVALGTGPITLLSNAVLKAVGAPNQSTTPSWASLNNTINIPAGQFATIVGPQRGVMQGNITGAGTLNYQPAYVRGAISGNWTNFTGQIIWSGSANGGNLGITGAATNGFGHLLCTNSGTGGVTIYNQVGGTPTIPIGEMADDGSTTSESSSSGGGNGLAANFAIGGLNTSTTFGGSIMDNVGIIKVGTGTLTLSSGALSYTGPTAVSNGVLALTASIPASSRFAIQAPGVLDVSTLGTLTVGAGTAAQTVTGNGTLNGSLAVSALGIVSAGFNNAIGTLTVANDVNLGGTNFMELNNTNAVGGTNDQIAAQTMTLGGTLTVTNIGARLHVGDTFQLLKTTGALSGSFSTVILPTNDASGATYTWTDNTAVNGSITVASVTAPSTVLPTVPPAITSFSLLSATNIVLNGTNAQTGATYYLLTSTNAAAPAAQWKTIATNVAAANNSYSFTNTNAVIPGAPIEFYMLSSTNFNP